jgi:hypothetical protein
MTSWIRAWLSPALRRPGGAAGSVRQFWCTTHVAAEMIPRHYESPGRQRQAGQQDQDEPLVLRGRVHASDPAELPRRSAARIRGRLHLDLHGRAMGQAGSDRQDVCPGDPIAGQGRSPAMPGESRAYPVLANCLGHLPIDHQASIVSARTPVRHVVPNLAPATVTPGHNSAEPPVAISLNTSGRSLSLRGKM